MAKDKAWSEVLRIFLGAMRPEVRYIARKAASSLPDSFRQGTTGNILGRLVAGLAQLVEKRGGAWGEIASDAFEIAGDEIPRVASVSERQQRNGPAKTLEAEKVEILSKKLEEELSSWSQEAAIRYAAAATTSQKQAMVNAADQRLDDIKNDIQTVEQRLNDAKNKLRRKEGIEGSTRSPLPQAEGDVEAACSRLDEAQQKKFTAEAVVNRIFSQLRQLTRPRKGEEDVHQEERQQLRVRLAAAEATQDQADLSVMQERAAVRRAEEQVRKARRELESAKSEVEKVRAEFNEISALLNKLREEARSAQETLRHAQQKPDREEIRVMFLQELLNRSELNDQLRLIGEEEKKREKKRQRRDEAEIKPRTHADVILGRR